MSSMIIVGVIVAIVLALIAMGCINQTIERNKEERLYQVGVLNKQARRFQTMLDVFPPQYLNQEIKIIICQAVLQLFEQIKAFGGETQATQASVNATQAQLEEIRTSAPAAMIARHVTDTDTAAEIQHLLTELSNYIQQLQVARRIDTNVAQNCLNHLRYLFIHCDYESLSYTGNAAAQQGNQRLAIYNYNRALKIIFDQQAAALFQNEIMQLKNIIADLNAQQNDASTTKTDTISQQLKSEWDEFDQENANQKPSID